MIFSAVVEFCQRSLKTGPRTRRAKLAYFWKSVDRIHHLGLERASDTGRRLLGLDEPPMRLARERKQLIPESLALLKGHMTVVIVVASREVV